MKQDTEIKQDVEAELRWTPSIDERHIAVAVNKGVVSLTGHVQTFLEKYDAERAVKRLSGVTGVANDIEVKLAGDAPSDAEIAENIVRRLQLELPQGSPGIKTLVHRGRVTLDGTVEWNFQRQHAEMIARQQRGVAAVTNLLEVQPRIEPRDISQRIKAAFHRSAQLDANQISVQSEGGVVTLKGRVTSWAESLEAQDAAWAAPGVRAVRNEIRVGG